MYSKKSPLASLSLSLSLSLSPSLSLIYIYIEFCMSINQLIFINLSFDAFFFIFYFNYWSQVPNTEEASK